MAAGAGFGVGRFFWYGFRIGEAPSKGRWIKRAEHPKMFKFAMAIHFVILAILMLVSLDLARRATGWPFPGLLLG